MCAGWVRDYTQSFSLCIHVQNLMILVVVATWTVEVVLRRGKRSTMKGNSWPLLCDCFSVINILWASPTVISLLINYCNSNLVLFNILNLSARRKFKKICMKVRRLRNKYWVQLQKRSLKSAVLLFPYSRVVIFCKAPIKLIWGVFDENVLLIGRGLYYAYFWAMAYFSSQHFRVG